MNQRGISQFIVIVLVLLAIPAGVYLAQTTQIFKPKANVVPPPYSSTPPGNSQFGLSHQPACPENGQQNIFRCHAEVVIEPNGKPAKPSSQPTASVPYGPAQLRGAYNLTGIASSPIPTIAITTAYDHPNILDDLNSYSSQYNLPTLPACNVPIKDSPIPCFSKLDQNGGTSYPTQVDPGWAIETAMDVEIAHAICENCKILLVEANTSSYYDLIPAIDQAVAQGAKIVSNSWGTVEFPSEDQFDSHFNIKGKAFTFSAGNGGYGVQYPASSQYVTAVGGTTLLLNLDNSYKSEVAWNATGSGCSLYQPKPSWQKDTGCTKRTVADVSAVADPNTGVAIYSSVAYNGTTGWFQLGGTSLAAPIIAGVYALGGIPADSQANSLPYTLGNTNNLHDIQSGTNGTCPKALKYLCTSQRGYDGPTGLGTPKGSSAF